MTKVSAALREEEAGSKSSLVVVLPGDRAGNGRFPNSCPAIQPEDRCSISLISPRIDLLENLRTSIIEASPLVLFLVRVESCFCNIR
jgi:hypothetical protein